MGEIVNLNRARKAKARAAAKTTAEENRIRFGRTKAEKDGLRREAERADRAIEGHRLEAEQKPAWGGRADVEATADPSSPPDMSPPDTSSSDTLPPGTPPPETSPSRDPDR